jgi:hypothetical protein
MLKDDLILLGLPVDAKSDAIVFTRPLTQYEDNVYRCLLGRERPEIFEARPDLKEMFDKCDKELRLRRAKEKIKNQAMLVDELKKNKNKKNELSALSDILLTALEANGLIDGE